MTSMQKFAWANLVVIALIIIAYLCLIPYFGIQKTTQGMAGMIGIIGLWGFVPIYYGIKRPRKLVFDERERAIFSRSLLAVLFVLWLYLWAVCMIPWFIYSTKGETSIAIQALPTILWGALFFCILTFSVAVLIQYGRESANAESGLLDRFRNMAGLQQASWMTLAILLCVLIPFLLFFPVAGRNVVENIFGIMVCLASGGIFWGMQNQYKSLQMGERDAGICRRAEKLGLLGLVITFSLGCLGLAVLYLLKGPEWISLNMLFFIGFCGFAVGLLVRPVSVLLLYAKEQR
ncbi:MAG TPA: hypothetical protein VM123_06145 [archaeon]|nr:hypothetical protein [archaeon]